MENPLQILLAVVTLLCLLLVVQVDHDYRRINQLDRAIDHQEEHIDMLLQRVNTIEQFLGRHP